MKIEFFILVSYFWNYTATLSQEMFREFSHSLCGTYCNEVNCPANTVMKIQFVDVMVASKSKRFCFHNDKTSMSSLEDADADHCQTLLKVDWSQHVDAMCSNKTKCEICQTQQMKINHEKCTKITDIVVKFLCISNSFNKDTVPADSYIELNCEYMVDYRIIIYQASLFEINKNESQSDRLLDVGKNKICSQIDVSSLISARCSFQTKCQAGPNQLIPRGCKKKQLLLQHACVPKSVLQLNADERKHIIKSNKHRGTQAPGDRNGKQITHRIASKGNNTKKDSSFEDKLVWIISGVSVLVIIILVLIVSIWTCNSGKCRTRQSSLFSKIKDTHFCPPPASIDKIRIDLSSEENLFSPHSKDYNTLLHNEVIHQLQCGRTDCDHLSNTISKNQMSFHSNPITNSSISSNGAGSSGQISNFQSESSRGNQSAAFNYLSIERSPPIQTYI